MFKPNIILQMQPHALQQLVAQMAGRFGLLQVYCFGKATLSVQHKGSFLPNALNHTQQYFLLLVTAGHRRIEHTLQDYATTHFAHGSVTIIAHGLATVQKELAKGSRFFNHAMALHNLWYSRPGALIPWPLQPPGRMQILKKANKQYAHHLPLAKGFLYTAKAALQKDRYGLCVFLLHQSVEQGCMAMIGVHLGYRADMHHLGRLLQLCGSFSALPTASLLGHGAQGQQLFKLLVQGYGKLRYKSSYKVGQHAAVQLYHKVAGFVALAKTLCQQEIQRQLASTTVKGGTA